MKTTLLLLLFLSGNCCAQEILSIDKLQKKPPVLVRQFTSGHIFSNRFPLYASDLPALIGQLIHAARRIDASIDDSFCRDTITAGHTRLLFRQSTAGHDTYYSFALLTELPDLRYHCEWISAEPDRRQLQRRLLDLAYYLDHGIR